MKNRSRVLVAAITLFAAITFGFADGSSATSGQVTGSPCIINAYIATVYYNPNIASGSGSSNYYTLPHCDWLSATTWADLFGTNVFGSTGTCTYSSGNCYAQGGAAYGNAYRVFGERRKGSTTTSWFLTA